MEPKDAYATVIIFSGALEKPQTRELETCAWATSDAEIILWTSGLKTEDGGNDEAAGHRCLNAPPEFIQKGPVVLEVLPGRESCSARRQPVDSAVVARDRPALAALAPSPSIPRKMTEESSGYDFGLGS